MDPSWPGRWESPGWSPGSFGVQFRRSGPVMRRDKLEKGLVDKVGMTVCIYVHLNNVAAKEGRKKRWFYGPSCLHRDRNSHARCSATRLKLVFSFWETGSVCMLLSCSLSLSLSLCCPVFTALITVEACPRPSTPLTGSLRPP